MNRILKTLSLLTVLCFLSSVAIACNCVTLTMEAEIASADKVFEGEVIEREVVGSKVFYKFEISKVWKGDQETSLTLTTGLGGPDCGAKFDIDMDYLVFSENGETDRCKPNDLLIDSRKIGLVRYHLDPEFKNQIGIDDSVKLSESEAYYFNSILMEQREEFDFTNKNVAYFTKSTKSNKTDYFASYGGTKPVDNLIVLNDEEQEATGLHAIIVSYKKEGVSKGFRKKMVKQLRK